MIGARLGKRVGDGFLRDQSSKECLRLGREHGEDVRLVQLSSYAPASRTNKGLSVSTE